LVLFLQYAILLQAQVVKLSYARGVVEKARGVADRLRELLELRKEDAVAAPVLRERDEAGPKDCLELRNVGFSYPGGRPVLEGVNLLLEPGDRIAILGPSGCGKTSLLKLLLRFYEPDEGTVFFGGEPISALRAPEWRRNVSFVSQEPALFTRPLVDNLRYGAPPAPSSELRLLDSFGLSGLLFRENQPSLSLSGGEKQRVAIARAMLRDTPLLILDEPTASLDLECEEAITRHLLRELSGRDTISIFVTHRPSLLRLATRVVEIKDGRLVESSLANYRRKAFL